MARYISCCLADSHAPFSRYVIEYGHKKAHCKTGKTSSNDVIVQVRMLADTQLELTKALGVEFDATGFLGSVRSKR